MDQIPFDMFQSLVQVDPTPTKKYLEWMIKQKIAGHSINDIKPTIEFFHKNIVRFKTKDINGYKDLKDLENEVKELSVTKSKTQSRQENKGKAKKLYEDANVLLVRPDDKKASMAYGANTKWCITMQDADYYEEYVSNNVIFYFVINKKADPSKDNMAKIAISVQRDEGNNISQVEYFDVLDNAYDEPPPDWDHEQDDSDPNFDQRGSAFNAGNKTSFSKLNKIALSDSSSVPMPFLMRLKTSDPGDFPKISEVINFWKNEFNASESQTWDNAELKSFRKAKDQKKKKNIASLIPLKYQKEIAKFDDYVASVLKQGLFFGIRGGVSYVKNPTDNLTPHSAAVKRLTDGKIFYQTVSKTGICVIEAPVDNEQQKVKIAGKSISRQIDVEDLEKWGLSVHERRQTFKDDQDRLYVELEYDEIIKEIDSTEHFNEETGEFTYTHKSLI